MSDATKRECSLSAAMKQGVPEFASAAICGNRAGVVSLQSEAG